MAGPAQPGSFHSLCSSSRAQRQQIEKERLEEEKKATGRLKHANELRRQVRENQQKQVQNRIATFEEGRRLKEEAQKRRERIDDIKKKKLEELRCTGILSSLALLTFPKGMAWQSGKCGFGDGGTDRCSERDPSPGSRLTPLNWAPAEGSVTESSWLSGSSLAVYWLGGCRLWV